MGNNDGLMQVKLKNKYRIWWGANKEIRADYAEPMRGVTSLNSKFFNYFETNNLKILKQKIKKESLKIKEQFYVSKVS